MTGTVFAIVIYWAERLVIWFLVYLAVSGVENRTPRYLLTPELQLNPRIRLGQFILVSLTGSLLVVVNPLLIGGLARWWNRKSVRAVMLVTAIFGVVGECGCAAWLAINGLRQLSPPFYEAVDKIFIWEWVAVAMLLLLPVGTCVWRALSPQVEHEEADAPPIRARRFHEIWLGSLLLGLVAAGVAVSAVITEAVEALRMGTARLDWQTFVYWSVSDPIQVLWLAAIIAGFTLSWSRWRRRSEPAIDFALRVDPAKFAIVVCLLFITLAVAAPILAACSFSSLCILCGL